MLIFRIDNDALDAMDQFKRAAIAILDGLRRLAPAAIEDGIGRRHPRRGVASLLRMMPTRTLMAVLVWLRASERISVRDFAMVDCDFVLPRSSLKKICGMIAVPAIISGANPISVTEAAGGRGLDATPRAGAFARAGQCDEGLCSERPTENARSGVFRAGVDGCDDVSMPVICPTAQVPLEKIAAARRRGRFN